MSQAKSTGPLLQRHSFKHLYRPLSEALHPHRMSSWQDSFACGRAVQSGDHELLPPLVIWAWKHEYYCDNRTLRSTQGEFLSCDGFKSNHRRCLIHYLSPLMCTKTGGSQSLICADIFKAEQS